MSGDLRAFLAPLGLEPYLATFEEEEIHTVALLKSMGKDMFVESMDELEMAAADVEKLSSALFGASSASAAQEASAAEDDEGLALEDNGDDDNDDDDDDGPPGPKASERSPGHWAEARML